MVEAAFAFAAGVVFDLRVPVPVRGGFEGCGFLGIDLPRDLDDVAGDAMFGEVLLGGEVTLAPFPGRGVGADKQQRDGGGDDDEEGDNESDSPCLVGCQAGLVDERVEDCRHQEVCDATSSIAKACSEGVASADHVLVEESSRPYLARYKATSKDTDEETESHETFGVGDCTCHHGGYGAGKKTSSESISRANEIAHRSCD